MKWYSCYLGLKNLVNKLDNNRLRYLALDFATNWNLRCIATNAILFIAMHFSHARGQRSRLEFIVKKTWDKNLMLDLRNTSQFSRLGDAMEARNNDFARHGVWYYVLVINQTEINLSLQEDVGFLFCHAKSMHCCARVWWSLWIKKHTKTHTTSSSETVWHLHPWVTLPNKKNILRVHSTMLKWIDYISKQKKLGILSKRNILHQE